MSVNFEVMEAAFLDELEKIGAKAPTGIINKGREFLGGGYKALGEMVSPAAKAAKKGAEKTPGLIEEGKSLFRGGAAEGKGAKGGTWEGIKRVAKGRPGQVAAAVGVPVAAGAAGAAALSSDRRQNQYGY